MRLAPALVVVAASSLAACSTTEQASDGGTDGGTLDAGGMDAGVPDAGVDAGVDAGTDGGGDAGDTWNSYAKGFFQTYCVHCHHPGGDDPNTGDKNFTMYSSVQKYSPHIRCGVAATQDAAWNCAEVPRQFPIASPFPSDPERDRLVAWINAGLPE
jgi:hypothetical protein